MIEFIEELNEELVKFNCLSRGDLYEFLVDFGIKGTEGLKIINVLLFELFSELLTMLFIVETRLDAVILRLEGTVMIRSAFSSSTLERGVNLIFLLLIYI